MGGTGQTLLLVASLGGAVTIATAVVLMVERPEAPGRAAVPAVSTPAPVSRAVPADGLAAPLPAAPRAAVPEAVPEEAPAPQAALPAAPPVMAPAVPVPGAASPAAEPTPVRLALPAFDLVRVDAGGQALVAGRAPPRFEVSIELDGQEITRALADADGAFAAFFDLVPGEAAQALALVARGPGGEELRSAETVLLTPPARALPPPAPRALAALPEGTGDAPADPPGDLPGDLSGAAPLPLARAPDPAAAPGDAGLPPDTRPPEPAKGAAPGLPDTTVPATLAAAPPESSRPAALLVAPSGEVRLMQPARPDAGDAVRIDLISYDGAGAVLLEGRSAPPPPPPDRVRVYLDDQPMVTVAIAADGTWALPLRAVAPGLYRLRVDQIDAEDRVVSRFETPFRREAESDLARLVAAKDRGGAVASVITVQPGYTLWGIARDRYGSGIRYVQVFEANRDQIRNPDLIYPGQVFNLPADLPDAPPADPGP